MNVLFPIAEAAPFVQIGGLGEIGGSLPKFINKTNKTKVRVIMPKYRAIPNFFSKQMKEVVNFEMFLSWRRIKCIVEEMEWEGVHYYFVTNEYYFERDEIYGYDDDGERFAFFCKAVLESLPYLDFQPDIIHCHDWHTALIPFLLQEHYRVQPYYFEIKSILTIHNLKHQGRVPLTYFSDVLGCSHHNKAAW
ncbi:MAG: glycogen/starch synthase, partial [Peptostreptococcales bacterium]